MRNTVKLLRRGGIVMHLNPVILYEHGFYGINPTLLHDYYQANGFEILKSEIVQMEDGDVFGKHWCFPYEGIGAHPPAWVLGGFPCSGLFFCARKYGNTCDEVIPIQTFYARKVNDSTSTDKKIFGRFGELMKLLKKRVPFHWKMARHKLRYDLQRYYWYRKHRRLL